MVSILNRKLFRDVIALRGPALTIGLLVAAGVAVMTGSISTYYSLLNARTSYYKETRFADLFVDLKRAPIKIEQDLLKISGVGTLQSYIKKDVRVNWIAAPYEVNGLMISLPDPLEVNLNLLTLDKGRWPDVNSPEEVLINVAFAEAWFIQLDSFITVLLNGRQRIFKIVGTVYSPEFIYAARPGNPLPDDKAYALLWTARAELESALNMKGAFNSLALKLSPGAREQDTINMVDRLLQPFGSLGVVAQRDQMSDRFLSDELIEQKTMSVIIPFIFFSVAAFLLNAIMGRIVNAQREQIATLKALGYPSFPIALHYAGFASLVAIAGSIFGTGVGIMYGKAVMSSYASFFRFPDFDFIMPIWAPAIATFSSLLAALSGLLIVVMRILRLTASQALRPTIPAESSHHLLTQKFTPRAKIALRNMVGRPVRTFLTINGLAMTIPMIVLGLFWWDALNSMINTQFRLVDRSDATISFMLPRQDSALEEVRRISPDVDVEGFRIVPVRLRHGINERFTSITGLSQDGSIRTVRDQNLKLITVPLDGIILSRQLADRLGLSIGAQVSIEVLDGKHSSFTAMLTDTIEEVLGAGAYMELETLNRAMGDASVVTHAAIRSSKYFRETLSEIAERPQVLSSTSKEKWINMFREKIMGLITVSASILTLFGIIVAVGVVYNSARVAFQERLWELACLRVLGFTRSEVANILFTELAISLLISVPIGLFLAKKGIAFLLTSRSNESFSIPPVIHPDTMALAVLIVIVTALISGWIVKRRIDNLDLVSALKTRD